MKRRLPTDLRGSFSMSAGWLFADLLLVLAMLFLAANTMGIHPPPIALKSTPTPTMAPTPKPKERVLEHNYCEITLDDTNPNTFKSDLNFAISTLKPQITSKAPYLNGRQVGLAIASGGTDSSNTALGIALAAQTYQVLQTLGSKENIFKVTSYYGPLFSLGTSSRSITIDMYLIVRSDTSAETCGGTTHQPI
ncbi:MAG: hypothetical protein ABI234_10630 [Ktedonobacteraceae bacterium]